MGDRRSSGRWLVAAALVAALAAGAVAGESSTTIGLVPGEDVEATTAVERGVRLALAARSAGDVRLVVGETGSRWGSAASAAVRLVREKGAVALIAPPDRATAHLVAQVATRARVPVVSTCSAESVTQAGTTWVVSVAAPAPRGELTAEFRSAFRTRFDREPDADAAAGYDAAVAILASLRRDPGHDLMGALRGASLADGARGPFGFDAAGSRVSARGGPAERTRTESPPAAAPARALVFSLSMRCVAAAARIVGMEHLSMLQSTAVSLPRLSVLPRTECDPVPPWVHALVAPVWVTSPEGVIRFLNAAAETLLGVSREQGLGLPCHRVVASRDDQGRPFCRPGCRLAARARRGEALAPVEVRVRGSEDGPNGNGPSGNTDESWAQWIVIPVTAPDGSGPWLVHVAQDVGRQRRATDYVQRLAMRSEKIREIDRPDARGPLSPRETEILDLLAADVELGRIAEHLGIRHTTARNHVQRLLAKLGAHSVQEAVALHLLR